MDPGEPLRLDIYGVLIITKASLHTRIRRQTGQHGRRRRGLHQRVLEVSSSADPLPWQTQLFRIAKLPLEAPTAHAIRRWEVLTLPTCRTLVLWNVINGGQKINYCFAQHLTHQWNYWFWLCWSIQKNDLGRHYTAGIRVTIPLVTTAWI
jgi:hypothetical protein